MTIILGILAKVLGSSAMGAITGILGATATGILDLKKKKMDYAHEEKMMDKERELAAMEIKSKSQIAEIDASARRDVADANALGASFNADKASYSVGIKIKPGSWQAGLMIFADFYRATVRPNLSYLGAILFAVLVWRLLAIMPLDVLLKTNPAVFWRVFEYTLTSAVFTIVTVVVWWYAGRARRFKG